MNEEHSIFFDEWRACLRAHYIHVLRTGDTVTEPSLRQVLLQTGASDEDLYALQVEALGAAPSAAEITPEAPFIEAPPLEVDDGLDDEPLYEDLPPDMIEDTAYPAATEAEDEGVEEEGPDRSADEFGAQLSLF